MNQLAPLVADIELAYERLGHRLGWRFLYSPARTLAPGTRLAFVGKNPGGGYYEPPVASVEEGNAYRVQAWGEHGGPTGLQVQIRGLYERLGDRIGVSSPAQLMDETLAANLCPFRSRSWELLTNKRSSIDFSRELWSRILDLVTPPVLICLGEIPARHLGAVLEGHGWRPDGGPEVARVGWGTVTYALQRYESSRGRTVVIRLPHLSRFAIVGRAESRPAVDRITEVAAAAMLGAADPSPIGSPTSPAPSVPSAPSPPRHTVRTASSVADPGLGARATALLGKRSYNISEYRAQRFVEMLDGIPTLRTELQARDTAHLRWMVSPGARVDGHLSQRFGKRIAEYAETVGYQQVNWLRGAIAVYIAAELGTDGA